MQSLPWAMFCQNSSRFLDCGNWPDIPITAMGSAEWMGWEAGAPLNRAALCLRQEVSFFAPRFAAIFGAGGVAILGCDTELLSGAADISAIACVFSFDSVPCFSASSLT